MTKPIEYMYMVNKPDNMTTPVEYMVNQPGNMTKPVEYMVKQPV